MLPEMVVVGLTVVMLSTSGLILRIRVACRHVCFIEMRRAESGADPAHTQSCAGDDGAGDGAEAGLGEARADGGAGGDVLEDFADEGGGADVFEEGVVGGACGSFLGVGDGGLEVGGEGGEDAGDLRCGGGGAAFDGVGVAH